VSGVAGNGGVGKDVTPLFGAAPQPFYLSNSPGTGTTSTGFFGGGGGGGSETGGANRPSSGGSGGGGNGGDDSPAPTSGIAGRANSGGGGGGSARNSAPSKAGGSGIVLVKIPASVAPAVSIAPGTNILNTQPCGAKVGQFTVSGSLTIAKYS
jgi:hypothetical protein